MSNYTADARQCADCKRYFYPNSAAQDYCFPCWREVRTTISNLPDPWRQFESPSTPAALASTQEELMRDLYEDGVREERRLRTMPYAEYLQTKWWQDLRKEMLLCAGYKCQLCGVRGPAEGTLQVHHLTYERRGCELPKDLVVLCSKCHEGAHSV